MERCSKLQFKNTRQIVYFYQNELPHSASPFFEDIFVLMLEVILKQPWQHESKACSPTHFL